MGAKGSDYKIMGISLPMFIILTAVVLTGTYLKVLPAGMIGAFSLMLIIGAIFGEIGNKTPIVNSFLGGGPIIIIFGSAALVTFNVLPTEAIENMTTFMKSGGFLDFYIAALITGSILGMSRKLLISAAVRYLPAIIGGVVVALLLVALGGAVMGFGAKEAVLYIGIPIMGGGMGAGAVPLSKIFGEAMAKDPTEMLSMMVPAVALGNALAIVLAGLLDRLGKVKKSLSGDGKLMVVKGADVVEEVERPSLNIKQLGVGLLLATTFFVAGSIISSFIPSVHAYAWMIITVAVVKIFGLLPREFEECAFQWYQFIMSNLTGVLLVGIGVAYTDLAQVADAFTIQYLILVALTVIGAIIGAGFVGKLVGFFPIESSITAGLCMANMGGTGDVAVLSAAKRMELMPFAQISSRIGGAFILILSSALLGIFL